jgi:hypothetical protein
MGERGIVDWSNIAVIGRSFEIDMATRFTEREVTVRFHRRAHLPIVLASELFNKSVAVPWWNGLQLRLVE